MKLLAKITIYVLSSFGFIYSIIANQWYVAILILLILITYELLGGKK